MTLFTLKDIGVLYDVKNKEHYNTAKIKVNEIKNVCNAFVGKLQILENKSNILDQSLEI